MSEYRTDKDFKLSKEFKEFKKFQDLEVAKLEKKLFKLIENAEMGLKEDIKDLDSFQIKMKERSKSFQQNDIRLSDD